MEGQVGSEKSSLLRGSEVLGSWPWSYLTPLCNRRSGPAWNAQMFTARLPEGIREDAREWLWKERRIEVPVGSGQRGPMIRVSIQAYNTPEHVDRLLSALQELLHVSNSTT